MRLKINLHSGSFLTFQPPFAVDPFDYREIVNWHELTNMAVALFVGLTALDTISTGSGGGGSSSDDNWRDRKDDDEIEHARRCTRAAAALLGKIPKSGRRR